MCLGILRQNDYLLPTFQRNFAMNRSCTAFLGLLGACTVATADRLIEIPVGRKIPSHAVQLRHMFDITDFGRSQSLIGYGIDSYMEAEIVYDSIGQSGRFSLDASYNISGPIPDISPGISVGVRDAANETKAGRYGYAVFSFQSSLVGVNVEAPMEGTVGLKYGKSGLKGFLGASLPFTDQVFLLAESDMTSLTFALEFRPIEEAQLRLVVGPRRNYASFSYRVRR